MCCRVRGDLVDALKRLIMSANDAPAGSSSTATPNAPDAEDRAAGAIEVEVAAASSGPGGAAKNVAPTEEQAQGAVAVLDGIILECSGLDELAPVLQVICLGSFKNRPTAVYVLVYVPTCEKKSCSGDCK